MFKSKFIVSLSAAVLISSASFAALGTDVVAKPSKKHSNKNIPVQLLSINDLHGYIEGQNKKDPAGKAIGGMESLAYNFEQEKATFAKANKLKSTSSNSLTVQIGDTVGGSPAVSGLLQDEPTMNILNAMNFSVATLGNHEFDEGLDEFQRILKGQAPIKDVTQNYEFVKEYQSKIAGNSALKATAKSSKMQVLSANINDKKTGKLLADYQPYTIKEVGGVKVGFIGIVTPSIKDVVLAQHTENIDIVDPGVALAKYTKELRKKGVNAITVLAHASVSTNATANTSIATQNDATLAGEVIDMLKTAEKLDPNNSIDVVFGGHNHAFANDTFNDIRIVQAQNYSDAYSVVTGTLNSKTKDFVKTPDAQVKYNYTQTADAIASNPVSKTVNGIVTTAKSIVSAVMDQPIATLDRASLSKTAPTKVRPEDRYPIGGSEVGNLVTDAQLAYAKVFDPTIDFAFTNSGGVRANLNAIPTGDTFTITRGAAQAVQPFGNSLNVIEITGAQVRAAINDQFIGGYGLEMSGLNYTFNTNGPVDIFVNGEKIDENKTYKAVLNDFLKGGGDKFPTFKDTKFVEFLGVDTDIFIDYLEDIKTVDSSTVTKLRLERVQ